MGQISFRPVGATRLWVSWLALLVVWSGWPSPSAGQDSPPADARALFERGLSLADEERWGEAVEYFRRSRAIEDRPSTAFNMGVALLRLARYTEAIEAFEYYLRASDPAADAEARAEATRLLRVARSNRATVRLRIEPPHARLFVDGTEVPGAEAERELLLDPGQRVLRVEADGFRSQTVRLSLLARSEVETRIDLSAAHADEPVVIDASATAPSPLETSLVPPAIPQRDDDDDEGGVLSSPVFWVVAGVVVAGAGVGIALAASGGDGGERYAGSTGVVLMP